MFPWGHLAVGYAVYSLGTRIGRGCPPDGGAALVLVLGTQLPDLIDKPANWWFGFLDGRGAAHSLLVIVPLCALVVLWARRRDRDDVGVALSVGVLTHVAGDAYTAIRVGAWNDVVGFLLWPVFPAPTYPKDSFDDHLVEWGGVFEGLRWDTLGAVLSSSLVLEFVFALLVGVLWAADGFPGPGFLWRRSAELLGSSTN